MAGGALAVSCAALEFIHSEQRFPRASVGSHAQPAFAVSRCGWQRRFILPMAKRYFFFASGVWWRGLLMRWSVVGVLLMLWAVFCGWCLFEFGRCSVVFLRRSDVYCFDDFLVFVAVSCWRCSADGIWWCSGGGVLLMFGLFVGVVLAIVFLALCWWLRFGR